MKTRMTKVSINGIDKAMKKKVENQEMPENRETKRMNRKRGEYMKINGETKVVGTDGNGSEVTSQSIDELLGSGNAKKENVSHETSDGVEINFDFIKRRTGGGDLEQYKTHMMNPMKSEGIAHVLRGLTGFIGTDLNFAILDILVGLFKLSKNKKVKPDAS